MIGDLDLAMELEAAIEIFGGDVYGVIHPAEEPGAYYFEILVRGTEDSVVESNVTFQSAAAIREFLAGVGITNIQENI